MFLLFSFYFAFLLWLGAEGEAQRRVVRLKTLLTFSYVLSAMSGAIKGRIGPHRRRRSSARD
jgi:hypothetical protein